MDATLELTSDTTSTAGLILLTIVAAELGGMAVLRGITGRRQS